jgi:hypothetical protein
LKVNIILWRLGKMDYDSMEYKRYTTRSEFDKAIHTLEGILFGIGSDRQIRTMEVEELSNWCRTNYRFINKQPYKELIPFITEALEDDYLDEEEEKSILWYCDNFKPESKYYDLITTDIHTLHGIMHGILADNKVTTEEVQALQKWLDLRTHLTGTYPYDELNGILLGMMADGIVDPEEEKILKVFFSDFILHNRITTINYDELELLREEITLSGVCSVTPEITIPERQFCFTGRSSRNRRSEIIDLIVQNNGRYVNSVSTNLDFLIVGDNGNSAWAFSCYGRKVEQAVQLRKTGAKLQIVHENDFWDCAQDMCL